MGSNNTQWVGKHLWLYLELTWKKKQREQNTQMILLIKWHRKAMGTCTKYWTKFYNNATKNVKISKGCHQCTLDRSLSVPISSSEGESLNGEQAAALARILTNRRWRATSEPSATSETHWEDTAPINLVKPTSLPIRVGLKNIKLGNWSNPAMTFTTQMWWNNKHKPINIYKDKQTNKNQYCLTRRSNTSSYILTIKY